MRLEPRDRAGDGWSSSPRVRHRSFAGSAAFGGAIVLSGLLWFASTARATGGSVQGHVLLPQSAPTTPEPNPYPGRVRAEASPPKEASHGRLEDVVVHLEGVSPPFHLEPPTRPRMEQRGQAFVPRVLPVLVGQKVDFPNEDQVYHNVFSYTPCCRFDLGRYPRGQSKPVTFDQTGIVRVFCEIHSDMAGYILVLSNPYFTRPSDEGAYKLEAIPPGQYRAVLWHPDLGRKEWPVTIAEGETVRLDLAF